MAWVKEGMVQCIDDPGPFTCIVFGSCDCEIFKALELILSPEMIPKCPDDGPLQLPKRICESLSFTAFWVWLTLLAHVRLPGIVGYLCWREAAPVGCSLI
jgi:hypothetical protein